MTPEQIGRSFDRFWRATSPTPTGRTGLRIAVVQHLARASGGDVKAERGLLATVRLQAAVDGVRP